MPIRHAHLRTVLASAARKNLEVRLDGSDGWRRVSTSSTAEIIDAIGLNQPSHIVMRRPDGKSVGSVLLLRS